MRHVSVLITAVAFAAACDSAEPTDTAQPSEAQQVEEDADDEAPDELAAREHHGRHGKKGWHGNPADRLCEKVECSDEQRTEIEALFERPHRERPDDTAAKQALADAFRGDAFSAADLEAFGKAAHGGRDRKAEHVETMAALHGILTPEQRAELADDMGERGFFGKGPEGKRGKFDDAKGAKFVEHKVGKLCAEIECSDDQRKKITAIVGQAKADRADVDMPERERVLADAMRAETFDSAAVSKQLEANEAAHEARHAAKHDAAVAIHGVLTPNQRDVIADRIEDEGPGALLGHHRRAK